MICQVLFVQILKSERFDIRDSRHVFAGIVFA